MKKSILCTVLAMLFIFTLLTGCKPGNMDSQTDKSVQTSDSAAPTGKEKIVKILQFKTEIHDQLVELSKEYMAEHPGVVVEIESVSSNDYNTMLKTKFASGEAPDIFNNQGYAEMQLWLEYLEDLSDQPWISDMVPVSKSGISSDGKIYGLPLYLEGYGICYNPKLFEKAKITNLPKTLTEFKDVCKKLEDAGITPINLPMGGWYNMGTFGVNVAMAHQPDVDGYIKALSEGKADFVNNKIFNDWANWVDVMTEYAKDPMTCDFSSQMSTYANEEVAMTLANNGAWATFKSMNPNIDAGYFPVPINDDAEFNDVLYAGVSTYWVVNKNSDAKEESKEFLNWLVSSERGKHYISDVFCFVPGLTSIKTNEKSVGPMSFTVAKAVNEGKVLGWEWTKYPSGMPEEFGTLIQMYVAGEINREKMLTGFMEAWTRLSK